MTAKVDPTSGKIIEYRACIDLSFGVIDEERGSEEFKNKTPPTLPFCNFRSYHPNSHKASNKNAAIAATAPIAAVMMTIFNAFLRVLRCCSLLYECTLMIMMMIIGIQSYSS